MHDQSYAWFRIIFLHETMYCQYSLELFLGQHLMSVIENVQGNIQNSCNDSETRVKQTPVGLLQTFDCRHSYLPGKGSTYMSLKRYVTLVF